MDLVVGNRLGDQNSSSPSHADSKEFSDSLTLFLSLSSSIPIVYRS